jgi:ABC-type lipoprotein export system ATPase subunit
MAEGARGGARLVAENIVVAHPLPRRGTLTVLDVDRLELPPGSQTAICGPSGSGKTTLLHLLCGIEPPRAGRVCWDGVDLFAPGEAARDRWRRHSVGLVFQQFHLFASLSPFENVLLPASFRAFRVGAAVARRARALLDRVGVRATGETASLSRGEMQRSTRSCPALYTADPARRRAHREPRCRGGRAGGRAAVLCLPGDRCHPAAGDP